MSHSTLQPQLIDQLYAIVQVYTDDLAQYRALASEITPYLAPVVQWIEQITTNLHVSPEACDYACIETTSSALDGISHFLNLMNQRLDDDFRATPLGILYTQASAWCAAATGHRAIEQLDDVWEWIAAELPNTIAELIEDETEPSRPDEWMRDMARRHGDVEV